MKFLLLFMTIARLNTSASELPADILGFRRNKHIPKVIERNVLIALSHYPELEHTTINFVFKKSIKGSVMQAQPLLSSVFKGNTSSKPKDLFSITPNYLRFTKRKSPGYIYRPIVEQVRILEEKKLKIR